MYVKKLFYWYLLDLHNCKKLLKQENKLYYQNKEYIEIKSFSYYKILFPSEGANIITNTICCII